MLVKTARSSSMLIESMFEPASAISEATLASTPRWFATVTLIAAWNRREGAGVPLDVDPLLGLVLARARD